MCYCSNVHCSFFDYELKNYGESCCASTAVTSLKYRLIIQFNDTTSVIVITKVIELSKVVLWLAYSNDMNIVINRSVTRSIFVLGL